MGDQFGHQHNKHNNKNYTIWYLVPNVGGWLNPGRELYTCFQKAKNPFAGPITFAGPKCWGWLGGVANK